MESTALAQLNRQPSNENTEKERRDHHEIIDESSAAKKQKIIDQNEPAVVTSAADDETSKDALNRKRKYALLIGYCGEGYYGLQRNASLKEYRTIEDEIVDQLVEIKSIPIEHANEMFKMSFQRAARTDKGVSAARNLLSLKMILNENTIAELNSRLPKQIRVFGYNKVTQGFDCKSNCDARTYIYILPTFAFCPIEELLTENYRASPETIKYVNELLKKFLGTKNFHNYTSGRKFTDPSAKRYIISFECSEPFIKEGYEFCAIKIKGQSFMLHQIRKMVGMIIAVARGFANEETLVNAWSAKKVDVPRAPALGLMLEKLHYEKYNKRFGNDGLHKPLEWPELEEEIESFKQEHIYSNIIKREIQSKSMFVWLARMPTFHLGVINPEYFTWCYTGVAQAYSLINKNDNSMSTNTAMNQEEEGSDD